MRMLADMKKTKETCKIRNGGIGNEERSMYNKENGDG
jgi:hypothetical protein